MRDVVEMLEPVWDDHEVELRLTVPDEPVFATTDRGKLTQIVANLVGNALKFSAPPVHIRLSVQDEWIRISVEDTGGVSPQTDRKSSSHSPSWTAP